MTLEMLLCVHIPYHTSWLCALAVLPLDSSAVHWLVLPHCLRSPAARIEVSGTR
jgi:hypothetical protein